MVLRLQLTKEDLVDRTIDYSSKEDILIVYDRGTLDNCAYISKEEFDQILERLSNIKSYSDLINKYDLVINLVGSKEFYTTENNKARSESVQEALELGNRTLNSWVGHKNLKIVKPKDTIGEKINEVLNIINFELKKNRVKRQEKYSVDLNNTNLEYVLNNSKCSCIEQVYLESDKDIEKRLRKIEFNDSISYIFSVFKIVDGKKELLKSGHLGNKYRRLFWDKPCACVATRNDQLAAMDTIHPRDDRVLSISIDVLIDAHKELIKTNKYDYEILIYTIL